ncbi:MULTISPECIES: carbohydrate ABC transporter permease [Hungatella]|uniref:ABC transporter permease subunit n=1 Tax=Hungatella hathewayi TaxID=154046 RepID=A0AAW9WLD2_9FIRM|nr:MULTISPECIES: carbohydrate ABC transporter permease [Hungatella]MCD8000116.1 carbohydrate ABC transporter permease [Clostridiales bacterium]MCI7381616.1 carbohydrate ABC transporter permease [Hungatella sp.]MCQ4830768.1 carbohydrate ABC transporter permease [Hungatella sp. SL.1.14]MCQ5388053.1 carbohydrate ABC transporter permease [Hungatella hathewayi]MDY6240289.1 carbohydrate ABC transporter permease [Hungatella hathewayi]
MSKKQKEAADVQNFNRISRRANFLLNIMFLILALICVIPAVLVVSISFSAEQSITDYGYRLIPKIISLDGYGYLLKQGALIIRALGVSLFVTIVGTVLGTLLTTLMGYVLSRPDYKLNGFLTMLVFIPMVFNGGLVSTYFIVSQFLHLKNTLWALILPLSVSSFNVVICRTFFKTTIPEELIESAKMDGATQFKIFFQIVLPISLPVIATIGLFLCFAYWNDWYQSMLYIDNQRLYSLQALLNAIMTNINMLAQNAATMGASMADMVANMPKEAARMAIVVIIVLPIACAYPFFQKYFISGLTVGAVKG